MTGNTNNRLYTLNTADGTATAVGTSGTTPGGTTPGGTTPGGTTNDFGTGESSGRGIATGYVMPPDFAINAVTGTITYTGASATAGREYTLHTRVSDGKAADDTASTAADDTVAIVTVEVVNLSTVVQRRQLLLHPHPCKQRQHRPRSGRHPTGHRPGERYPHLQPALLGSRRPHVHDRQHR